MQLAFPLEITRPDFARHVAFLRECRVDQIPLYTMLDPEHYQKSFGADTSFDDILNVLRDRIETIRGQGLRIDVLYILPAYGIQNTIGGNAGQQARFQALCRLCGELEIRHIGAFPLNEDRAAATDNWRNAMLSGARFMADAGGEYGIKISNHINMYTGSRLDTVADMEDLFARVDRDNWGLLFCFGCIALSGHDVPTMIRRWRHKIFTVHVRDVRGAWATSDAEEAQFGTGRVDLPESLRALKEIGYSGTLHPEHFPKTPGVWPDAERIGGKLPLSSGSADGTLSVVWTLGFWRGLLDAPNLTF